MQANGFHTLDTLHPTFQCNVVGNNAVPRLNDVADGYAKDYYDDDDDDETLTFYVLLFLYCLGFCLAGVP